MTCSRRSCGLLALRVLLLGGALVSLGIPSQAQSRKQALPLKIRNELKKSMLSLVRAKSEEAANALVPTLYVHGKKGVEFLSSLRDKKGYSDWVDRITASAPGVLGLDLSSQDIDRVSDHLPTYFGLSEIVLLKKDGQFAGFKVLDGSTPESGSLTIKWWSQTGKVKKLDQAGGKRGELAVTGVPSGITMRSNTGFTEFDFSFEVDGLPVEIHFVGPAFFRCKLSGEGIAVALTGEKRANRLSSSDDSIHFDASYSRELARVEAWLPKYLFRTIPGCEPLPLEGDEIDQFSQYEMVQVEVRQTRPKGEPVVMVKFLEMGRIGFEPYHYPYIVSFVNEIIEIPSDRVLLMLGSSPGLEGNRFFRDGDWARPPSSMVKILRANFPEAY